MYHFFTSNVAKMAKSKKRRSRPQQSANKLPITRYGVGLDMSKDDFLVRMLAERTDRSTKTVGSRKFKNNASGHQQLVAWVLKRYKTPGVALLFLMEVTGCYHENLLYYLYENGYQVHLALGKRTKAFMKSEGYKSKTDKIDAHGLALMVLQKQLSPWSPASKHILRIRQILRLRRDLVNQRTRFTNKLKALLAGYLKEDFVRETLERNIASLNEQVDMLEKKAFELLKQDEELHQHVNRIADSVPGLGTLTVLSVLAETNGFKNFSSLKQLISYAGYDVVQNQSGKYQGQTRISKQGNARIRAAMHMASVAHIRGKSGPIYQLFERLMARNGGIYKKAAVAVQRKLLRLIYTLWKNNTSYDPQYHLKQKAVALTN